MKNLVLIVLFLLGSIKIFAAPVVNENTIKINTAEKCKWTFNGDEIANVFNNEIEAKESGIYKVEYTNEAGVFIVKEFAVVIYNGKIITIRLIGDSTVCDYDASRAPLTGWGQVLTQIMISDSVKKIQSVMQADSIVVVNYARGGRSTRTFYEEGLWEQVYNDMQEGDYLFIQFGHNDASESHPDRYVDTAGYKYYLRYFINQTREKGGVPVLITPVNRNYPWSAGKLTSVHGNYPIAMKQVAEELHVPLIDLTTRSCEHFTEMGESYCSDKYFMNLDPGEHVNYPDGSSDGTHFQVEGALAVANLVYQGLTDLRDVFVDSVPDTVGVIKGAGWYELKYDSVAELSAWPKMGYKFSGWSGDSSSTGNPLVVKLDSNINIYATFEETSKPQYYVSVGKTSGGNVHVDPIGGLYEEGDTLLITATPGTNREFYSWYGTVNDTLAPYALIVSEDAEINALFKKSNETIFQLEEAATVACKIDSAIANYTLGYYAVAGENAGDSIVWPVYPAEDANYYLSFRYTGAHTERVYADIYLNGELAISNYTINPVAEMNQWKYSSSSKLSMLPGKNMVKVIMTSGSAPVYIDHLKFIGKDFLDASTVKSNVHKMNDNLITVSPNPSESNSTLSIGVNTIGKTSIQLLDIRGVLIETIFTGTLDKEQNTILYHLNNRFGGHYIVRIQNEGSVDYQKIIIQ